VEPPSRPSDKSDVTAVIQEAYIRGVSDRFGRLICEGDGHDRRLQEARSFPPLVETTKRVGRFPWSRPLEANAPYSGWMPPTSVRRSGGPGSFQAFGAIVGRPVKHRGRRGRFLGHRHSAPSPRPRCFLGRMSCGLCGRFGACAAVKLIHLADEHKGLRGPLPRCWVAYPSQRCVRGTFMRNALALASGKKGTVQSSRPALRTAFGPGHPGRTSRRPMGKADARPSRPRPCQACRVDAPGRGRCFCLQRLFSRKPLAAEPLDQSLGAVKHRRFQTPHQCVVGIFPNGPSVSVSVGALML